MPISTDQAIATEVRAELAAKRVRVAELAAALNISSASASMRIQGHVAMSIGELTVVSALLEVSVAELISRASARRLQESA